MLLWKSVAVMEVMVVDVCLQMQIYAEKRKGKTFF